MQIQGNIGIFTIGRKILKKNPIVELAFIVNNDNTLLFETTRQGVVEIIREKTKFGRIGIIVDRKNFSLLALLNTLVFEESKYSPKDKRAEKIPKVSIFITQCLENIALEGLADSIEFRRLARKYIRHAKNANCDTLFFPELIFGEEKIKKILQHLVGTQIKVFTATDFFNPIIKESKRQNITITYDQEEPVFLKQRAEKILKTKLKSQSFKKI